MLPHSLSCEESRRVDQIAVDVLGFNSLVLMENAGRGCVDHIVKMIDDGPISICCGKGNNGGDGFVIARHLKIRRFLPTVFLFADPTELTGDALANYEILKHCDVPIRVLPQRDGFLAESALIVDALLGTGSVGAPREPIASVIRAINGVREEHGVRVVAIDVPSGLNADTGIPNSPTIRADATLTFVRPKTGFLQLDAVPFLGRLSVLDIGVPESVVSR